MPPNETVRPSRVLTTMVSPAVVAGRYLSSMSLVFGSLDPVYKTLPERTFAIFAYVVMVIIDGSVAGVLASIMVRMGGKDQEVHDRLSSAKNWMKEHRIPKAQALRAMEYLRLFYKSRVMSEEHEILEKMPPNMRLEFSSQLYTRYLMNVPLFRGLPDSLLHSVCAIVEPMLAVRGQVVYSESSTGKEMYLLLEGELEITSGGERLGFLGDGAVSSISVLVTTFNCCRLSKRAANLFCVPVFVRRAAGCSSLARHQS